MANSINSKPSLLYIDDSPEFLLLFQASLKNDYNITTADSAEIRIAISKALEIQNLKEISMKDIVRLKKDYHNIKSI